MKTFKYTQHYGTIVCWSLRAPPGEKAVVVGQCFGQKMPYYRRKSRYSRYKTTPKVCRGARRAYRVPALDEAFDSQKLGVSCKNKHFPWFSPAHGRGWAIPGTDQASYRRKALVFSRPWKGLGNSRAPISLAMCRLFLFSDTWQYWFSPAHGRSRAKPKQA